jgi:hypothetical protein
MDLGTVALPSATAALKGFDSEIKAILNWTNGDHSEKSLHDVLFGNQKPEDRDALQKKLDSVADNPVARASQAIGNWLYNRAAMWRPSAGLSGPHGVVGPGGPNNQPSITVAPPLVTSTANVDVKVYLDGNLLGTSSATDSRASNSSYDHDGRMGFAGPDVRN